MNLLLEVHFFSRFAASLSLAILIFFASAAHAERLLETIEIPKRSPFDKPAESQQNVAEGTTQAAEETQAHGISTDVKEYQINNRTVREYRIAGQLQYIEITNEGAPSYIVEYRDGTEGDGFSGRSGIRISGW